jgi:hypothetical protein
MDGEAIMPAGGHLFDVNEATNDMLPDHEKADFFHHNVAKLLFCANEHGWHVSYDSHDGNQFIVTKPDANKHGQISIHQFCFCAHGSRNLILTTTRSLAAS